jgi:hypothetical protein
MPGGRSGIWRRPRDCFGAMEIKKKRKCWRINLQNAQTTNLVIIKKETEVFFLEVKTG